MNRFFANIPPHGIEMIEENRFESASFNGHSMRVLMQYEDGINEADAAGTAGRCRGPALALVSDGMFVRTESERTSGLAAASADVRRLRLAADGRTALQPTFEAETAETVGHYYYSQIDNRYRFKGRDNA